MGLPAIIDGGLTALKLADHFLSDRNLGNSASGRDISLDEMMDAGATADKFDRYASVVYKGPNHTKAFIVGPKC